MHKFSVYKRSGDKRKKDTKWIVAWTDQAGRRRAKTAFTDYEASVELGRKLARRAALASVGRVDRFEEHSETPVEEHLEAFIDGLWSAGRADRYVEQVEQRIRTILTGLKVKFLHELDPVAVDRFLTDLARKRNLSAITRNEYITSIKSFTKWAVTYRRMKDDVLTGLRLTERRGVEPAHPRRALSVDEIARLLDAAERRPLLEFQTVRIGPNAGKPVAKVTERVAAKAMRKGRERWLVYMLAVWTGLRRGEIKQLTWGDIQLDTAPGHIHLRAQTTKSKRADSLPIHPQLRDALRAWRAENAPVSTDEGTPAYVVRTVPDMKCLRADLALAGIPDKDEAGRYVDFHSLRVSLSTMLAAHKVSPRAAQALMRHSDPRLTASVYTDEKLLPLAAELGSVPAIPGGRGSRETALDLQMLVAELSAGQRHALLRLLRRTKTE